MIPLESITAFCLVSVILALAPGPDNLFVLTQSALHGRKSGVLVTIGLCTGLVLHTSAVALGVTAIFQTSAFAFTLLKTAGTLYLLYLAWKAFTVSETRLQLTRSNPLSPIKLYRRGIVMNATNPKVSIFFLAFLTQFTAPINGPMAQQIFLLGGIFILITFLVFSSIAVMAGTLGEWLNKSPKVHLYLNRVAGMIFAGLAIKLLMTDSSIQL